MSNGNLLFESVFKRKLSAGDTGNYLARVADEHPYFSPAQFFLLLKTEKGTALYRQRIAKTAVLFNNPHWLQFKLQEEEPGDDPGDVFPENDHAPAVGDHFKPVSIEAGELPGSHAGPAEIPAGTQPTEPVDTIGEKPEAAIQEPTVLTPGEINDQQPVWENLSGNEEPVDVATPVSAEEAQPRASIVTGLPQAEIKAVATAEKEALPAGNTGTDAATEINVPVSSVHFNNDSTPLINEAETEKYDDAGEETEPLNFKLNIDTATITEDKISFEPLHTSDYFASLGIKLSGDIKPDDKLGKQLKSFTEWLKTMKKIHSDQLPPLSGQADISIQQQAEQSNKEDTIVTEAMAEVLVMQGKPEKAIGVYKKLSLLNPSKTTYFAAKIDQLKEH